MTTNNFDGYCFYYRVDVDRYDWFVTSYMDILMITLVEMNMKLLSYIQFKLISRKKTKQTTN